MKKASVVVTVSGSVQLLPTHGIKIRLQREELQKLLDTDALALNFFRILLSRRDNIHCVNVGKKIFTVQKWQRKNLKETKSEFGNYLTMCQGQNKMFNINNFLPTESDRKSARNVIIEFFKILAVFLFLLSIVVAVATYPIILAYFFGGIVFLVVGLVLWTAFAPTKKEDKDVTE